MQEIPRAVEQLGLCVITTETVLWSPGAITTEAHKQQLPKSACPPGYALKQGEPLQWEALSLQLGSSPCLLQLEKSPRSNEDPAQPKINEEIKFILKSQGFEEIFALPWSWRRQRQPTPVLLPGKSHGWRSLVGCSPWGRKESDTTERLHFHFHFHTLEKEMATHSSVLVWRIPGTAEPGGLPSMGSHRVRHDWSDLAAAAT